MIEIPGGPEIPDDELAFVATRSGGPGGQHVNKTATRITLAFDVAHSPSLNDHARRRILERLATRISSAGILRVSSSRSRSQKANRDAAMARFVELLAWALADEPPRVPTRPTAASRRRRLESKKTRSAVKSGRTRHMERSDED